jgi:hypothetical protein
MGGDRRAQRADGGASTRTEPGDRHRRVRDAGLGCFRAGARRPRQSRPRGDEGGCGRGPLRGTGPARRDARRRRERGTAARSKPTQRRRAPADVEPPCAARTGSGNRGSRLAAAMGPRRRRSTPSRRPTRPDPRPDQSHRQPPTLRLSFVDVHVGEHGTDESDHGGFDEDAFRLARRGTSRCRDMAVNWPEGPRYWHPSGDLAQSSGRT